LTRFLKIRIDLPVIPVCDAATRDAAQLAGTGVGQVFLYNESLNRGYLFWDADADGDFDSSIILEAAATLTISARGILFDVRSRNYTYVAVRYLSGRERSSEL
jgi:hypothetical protein